MADKKISLSAVDSGVASMMDKLRGKAKESYAGLLEDAKKYSKDLREQNKYLEEQIKLTERRTRTEQQEQQMRYNARVKAGIDPETAKTEKGNLVEQKLNDNVVASEVRALHQELRQQPEKTGKSLAAGASSFAGSIGKATIAALGLAAAASAGGMIAKAISEGSQLDQALGRLHGTTGIEDTDFGYNHIGGKAGSAKFGMKQSEFIDYADQLSKERGYGDHGNKKLAVTALDQLATEKAYGLDTGFLTNMSGSQSLDRNKRETPGDIQNFKTIMSMGKDMSRLPKLLEIQNSLQQKQMTLRGTFNSDDNARLMATFQNIGRSGGGAEQFGNINTMGGRIDTMNNAIIKPGNDFKQAFTYNLLRKMNPNGTKEDLDVMQEKGLTPELLKAAFKQMSSQSMGDRGMYESIKSYFDLSSTDASDLRKAWQTSPKDFDKVSKRVSHAAGLTEEESKRVYDEGSKNSGVLPKELANFDELMGKGGLAALKTLDTLFKNVPTDIAGIKAANDELVKYAAGLAGTMEMSMKSALMSVGQYLYNSGPHTLQDMINKEKAAKNKVPKGK